MNAMGGDEGEAFDGSFMELLGRAQNREEVTKPGSGVEDQGFLFSSFSSSSSPSCYPQMLHFGGGHDDSFLLNDYDYDGSAFAAKGRSRAKSMKKLDGNPVASRKPKAHGSATIKARKEKVGDRIGALQQLVSPFGKTDTSTVLHEAFGYIRFLQDQVQVLSSAYLQQTVEQAGEPKDPREADLRSRGLCLVPVSFVTGNMADNSGINSIIINGADLWSPAAAAATMGGGSSSSSSGSKH